MTATDVADYEAGTRQGRSELRVTAGETLTERQALEALLVGSANNIADALARWDAGSVPAFVDRMNAEAVTQGLAHTHYVDPSGIDAGNVGTALDELHLAEVVLRVPTLAAIVAEPHVTLPVAGSVSNYNSLVGRGGVVGVKTGSTNAAGGCWVFAAWRPIAGSSRLVVGVVLSQRGPDLLQAAFTAGQRLLDAASGAVVTVTVLPAGSPVGQVVAGDRRVPMVTAAPVGVPGWPGLPVRLELRPVPIGRRLLAGSLVARLHAYVGDQDVVVPVHVTTALALSRTSGTAPSLTKQ
jgi:D-alanyl-D-alanine carboxypeptidase (penicillin-binding protein 5/6)